MEKSIGLFLNIVNFEMSLLRFASLDIRGKYEA